MPDDERLPRSRGVSDAPRSRRVHFLLRSGAPPRRRRRRVPSAGHPDPPARRIPRADRTPRRRPRSRPRLACSRGRSRRSATGTPRSPPGSPRASTRRRTASRTPRSRRDRSPAPASASSPRRPSPKAPPSSASPAARSSRSPRSTPFEPLAAERRRSWRTSSACRERGRPRVRDARALRDPSLLRGVFVRVRRRERSSVAPSTVPRVAPEARGTGGARVGPERSGAVGRRAARDAPRHADKSRRRAQDPIRRRDARGDLRRRRLG